MNYQAVIGLEIHAELKTKSKMFCSCPNNPFAAKPNTNVCPICLGMPGTLPVPNKRAVELTLKTGQALHCQPGEQSKFDRKNYFYPDLPKGYQISQYDQPLMQGGQMRVEGKTVRIRRVHLEEDTGKLLHKEKEQTSLVDYNRAGVPLLELVTEPDITSSKMASAFARELQTILRHLGASDADMDKGQLRVEANVSIKSEGGQPGTKVEIKNLNSFRSVTKALDYEISRQLGRIEKNELVVQETRGWDERKGMTFAQRTKEEAEDYRYFPEPDIPPLNVAGWEIEKGQLPEEQREVLIKAGLRKEDAELFVKDVVLRDFFDKIVASSAQPNPVTAARLLINMGWNTRWDPEVVGQTIKRFEEGAIPDVVLKESWKKNLDAGRFTPPSEVQVISDQSKLATIISKIVQHNPAAVSDYRAGKKEAFDFLVGQVMKESRGQADPKLVNQLLKEELT